MATEMLVVLVMLGKPVRRQRMDGRLWQTLADGDEVGRRAVVAAECRGVEAGRSSSSSSF